MTTPASNNSGLVDSNGQSIYYEIHGEGAPLVLIMGIGYDATLWGLHQVPELSKHYQVIVFDNRDAGRSSPAAGPYTVADMADDVAGLLDALEIERAHVLGLSMGGMIAQELALRHPGKIDKLILTGTAAGTARAKFDAISTWGFVKSRDEAGLDFAAQQFVWLFSEDFLRNHEAVAQTLEMLASNPNPVGAEAYQRQVDAYVAHDTLDRLNKIQSRTLVISGERDRLTPPWVCQEVADAMPAAEITFVDGPGSSHVLPLERPTEFNALVLSFLDNGSQS